MALAPGARLGPYEIVAPLGSGGMGEVYKGRDTRLDRVVAIKVLREHLANDPDRRARFDREARAISKLNHPNICTLYDVGHENGIDYLVVEFIEGQTLAERLKKGALPIPQALAVAIDIAAALDAAHRAGIVHRDLKPANVMLTKGGAKLLDFGIAREIAADTSTMSITRGTITGDGVVIGTPQYMAPEQLEGCSADARSDLFAFGAVLYEMLTGTRAFAGDTRASVIAAVLEREPAPLAPTPSAEIERLVRKCLLKDPERRWQTASDLLDDLRWLHSRNRDAQPSDRRVRSNRLAVAVITIAIIVMAVSIWRMVAAPPAASPSRVQFQVVESPNLQLVSGAAVTLSPDGRWMVFPAASADGTRHYWLRSLDSTEARMLPDTERGFVPAAWSSDSRFVFFATTPENDNRISVTVLKKVDVNGGFAQVMTSLPGNMNGATSTSDGTVILGVLASPPSPLLKVSINGGTLSPVTSIAKGERSSHLWPQLLPDGKHFLYFCASDDDRRTGVYAGSIDAAPDQQPRKFVLATDHQASFVPSRSGGGHLLFLSGTTLRAQRFDTSKLETVGESFAIADGIATWAPAWYALFSASANGVLAYRPGPVGRLRLSWFDEHGIPLGTLGDPADYDSPAISPDGTRVAVAIGADGLRDIWIIDVERNTRTRLTLHPSNGTPVWSPDGKYIAFSSGRERPNDRQIYIKPADGTADERRIGDRPGFPTSWSPDGRLLLFTTTHVGDPAQIYALPDPLSATPRASIPVITRTFDESLARFSPDGHWISYRSTESDTREIYMRSFSSDGRTVSLGPRVLASSGGGVDSAWSSDGTRLLVQRNIYGVNIDGVSIDTRNGLHVDPPKPFLAVPQMMFRNGWDYDRRHTRTLLVTSSPASAAFTIVLNWEAALSK